MCRRSNLVTLSVLLLAIFTYGADAKYKKYASVQENRNYKDILSLLAPEKMFTNYDKVFGVYADDEVWLNSTCRRDLVILEEAIRRSEIWALTMLDASSKLQSGLLQGNLIDLGQYDECLAVYNNSSGNDIRGHHCMYSISMTQENGTIPINPTLSICLPTTCSSDEIITFFNTTISWVDQLKDLKIKIVSATCSPVDPVVWDLEFIVCLSIFAGFVTFIIVCTMIDLSHRNLNVGQYRHPFANILAMFSLRRNAASILNMEIKQGTLPAIHGIRCLSMAWVVLGHEFVFSLMGVTVNTLDAAKWVQSWKSLYLFTAPFAVDTFFTISGFLMTYLFLKQMPKQKKFNIPLYYFHRYFRLTPAVIALLVFTIVFAPKLGSGARWNTLIGLFSDNCRTKWWSSLLYVQNFVEKENMCLGHLWYLAVDMQLFWISPLILYPLYKKPKLGLMILAVLFLASLAIPALVIGIKKLPVMSFLHANSTVTMEVFTDIYEIPYHRAAPWLVGIFLGYKVSMHNHRLTRWSLVAGWSVMILSFAFCIFGTRSFLDSNYEYNAVWETFFSAVSRPIWAFGICWIIYATIQNQAGPLTTILASRMFLPLSRLSYCVYLVHIVVLAMNVAALRTPTYFSDYYIWRSFFSTITISIMVAFIFSLFFESPIMVLEKIMLKRKREYQCESQKELSPNENEESTSEK